MPHPQPRLQAGDFVRLGGGNMSAPGEVAVIVTLEWPSGWTELETLDQVLARCLAVSDEGQPEMLQDMLIRAGWTPPSDPDGTL